MGALAVATAASGQSNKVISAQNYLRDGEYKKALENIEDAKDHSKTSDRGKTWLYRGQIYLEIGTSEDPEVQKLAEDALFKAIESFKKAKEIGDRRVSERELDKYYQQSGIALFQNALEAYNNKKFNYASRGFETSSKVREEFGVIDTSAIFNAGLAAEYDRDTARALKFYEKSAELGYRGGELYASMAQLHNQQGNQEKTLEVLLEGRKKYPDDQTLVGQLINMYLKQGKSDEAIEMIDEALKANPDDPELLFAKGALYDEKGDEEKALESYEKAIEVDPENHESWYNLGAIYVNKTTPIQEKMNELDYDQEEEYTKLKKERNALFEKALEPLEKAHELDPDDLTTMQTLAQIYAQLEMRDKYKALKKKIDVKTTGGSEEE